jgi:hypothetical protein
MIRPNFLSAANRLELERCLRRHREEHGIARRANAILVLSRLRSGLSTHLCGLSFKCQGAFST